MSDRELERLLIANLQSGEGDLEELSVFVQDVKTLLAEPPDEAIAARHLAAMTELAQRLAEGEAHAGPARTTSRSDRERSGNARSWRKPMRLKLLVAAAGVVVLTAFGGAAYAGVLPAGVQSSVADLAGKVGVTLPADESDVDEVDVTGVDEDDQGVVDIEDEGDVDLGDPADDVQGHQSDDDQGDDDQREKADDQGQQGDDDDQGDDDQGQQGDDDDQGDDDQGQQGDDDDQGDDHHGGKTSDQGDDDQGHQSDDDQGHQNDDDDQGSSDSDQ